jgi:phytoene/squalene synthetase
VSLNNCIDIVSRHDPDKFLALMAGDNASRRVAFPIYAFNVEVSRVPWITSESLIAEMRLMWWQELLEAIELGKILPEHPISYNLSQNLDKRNFAIKLLKKTITARRWDIYSKSHESNNDLWEYVEHTSSNLLAACSNIDDSVISFGRGIGMASYLMAVPQLLKAGKKPLPDLSEEGIYILAKEALNNIKIIKSMDLDKKLFPIFRIGWMAPIILKKIINNPRALLNGTVQLSEFRKKVRLFKLTLQNSY